MKLTVLTFLLLLTSFQLFAQFLPDSPKTNSKFTLNPWEGVNGIRLAAGYFHNFESEVSYLVTSYPKRDPGLGGLGMRVQYIGLGLEYIRVGNNNILGTKLSYENTFAIFALQIGTDFLVSDKGIQWRILPKAGLTLFGAWSIYYGYNFNLITNSSLLPSAHLISLQCTILK